MSITLGCFNVENLFARYRFQKGSTKGPAPLESDGFTINDLAFETLNPEEKKITAKAIKEIDADILALEEIESLPVLDKFVSDWLPDSRYVHKMLVDSHDPRHIDIALLSRHPITSTRTYRYERTKNNRAWLFSRDCLVAKIDVQGRELTLYINHFKSMMEGRSETHDRRVLQVERVVEILDQDWKPRQYDGNFAVLGDFNDYKEGNTSLTALLDHPQLVDVVARLPEAEQWTHYYDGGEEYRQLDFILLSKALAEKNPGKPVIMRKGMPKRAKKYTGPWFPGVEENHPKASDHAPVAITLDLV